VQKVLDSAPVLDYIIELQREQTEQGLSPRGGLLRPEYASKYYAKKKIRMGSKAPFMTPNLKLTGDLLGGLYVKSSQKFWIIQTEDEKIKYHEHRYWPWGLNKQNMEKLRAFVFNLLKDNIRYGL
jgi:hypothetical protein